jgi:hypothetical protein
MGAQEMIFTIRLDDGSLAEATTWDAESARTFQKLIEDPAYGRDLRIRATEPSDTSGHAMAADTITVSVRQEDDLEGHTMTLRFPSVDEAKRFQKRLIISGALAASIVVGAAGVQLASQQGQQVAAPAAGPAIVQQAPSGVTAPAVRVPAVEQVGPISPSKDAKDARDSISVSAPSSVTTPGQSTLGSIDARLRDSSTTSGAGGSTVISPQKDAKDDQASSLTDGSPAQPGSGGRGFINQ